MNNIKSTNKYLVGFTICFLFSIFLHLPVNNPISLDTDAVYYYKISERFSELFFGDSSGSEEDKSNKFSIFATQYFKKISKNTWRLSKNTLDNPNILWKLVNYGQLSGKTIVGSIQLQSTKDINVQVFLCSHNGPWEGATRYTTLKANKPHSINLHHKFKNDSDGVVLQVNMDNQSGDNIDIQINNIEIVESYYFDLLTQIPVFFDIFKEMPHFVFPVSVSFVKKFTGMNTSNAGIVVMFILQLLLLCFIYISYNISDQCRGELLTPAWLVILTCSLLLTSHIPALYFKDSHLYFGYIVPVVYHNATMTTLKPFALVLFLLSLKIFQINQKTVKYCFISSFLIVLATFSKPVFTIIFLPALSSMVLLYFLLNRSLDWKIFLLGIILPSILILSTQYYFTYSESKSDGIIFSPLGVMGQYSDYLAVKFLLSTAFPLSVLLLYRKCAFNDSALCLAWMIALFGFMFTYFFAESGPRFSHGNFGWCGQIGLFILFYASILFLIKNNALDSLRNWRCFLADKKLLFCVTLYLIHFCSGVFWWYSTASLCYDGVCPRSIW
jgi:hypothetical protein